MALGTVLSGAVCAFALAEVAALASDLKPAVEKTVASSATSAQDLQCRAGDKLDVVCLRTLYQHVPRQWPEPTIDPDQAWQEWGPVPGPGSSAQPEAAADAKNKQIVSLGARLFFDPKLSSKGQISCASCHQPDKSFTDGKALAVGEDGLMGKRRSPPLLAAPFADHLFWDGRAKTLKEQVLGPIENPVEMNHKLEDLIRRLQASEDYPAAFQQAFSSSKSDAVNADSLSRALAAYIVTIRPAQTRFDDFVAGDIAALNDQELIGMHLFRTQARCMNCHSGPMLTDHSFHNIGLSFYGRRLQDLGRFEWTKNPADLGVFRTPSLRNVARAGPWMHNGLFPSLDGLLRMYDVGMGADPKETGPLVPRKSERIQPLNLSDQDIQALQAFLEAL